MKPEAAGVPVDCDRLVHRHLVLRSVTVLSPLARGEDADWFQDRHEGDGRCTWFTRRLGSGREGLRSP